MRQTNRCIFYVFRHINQFLVLRKIIRSFVQSVRVTMCDRIFISPDRNRNKIRNEKLTHLFFGRFQGETFQYNSIAVTLYVDSIHSNRQQSTRLQTAYNKRWMSRWYVCLQQARFLFINFHAEPLPLTTIKSFCDAFVFYGKRKRAQSVVAIGDCDFGPREQWQRGRGRKITQKRTYKMND